MTAAPVLAVDLGGTNVKIGLVAGAQVLAAGSFPARAGEGLAPQLPRLATALEGLCAQRRLTPADCRGLALAVPFLVDPGSHRIRAVPRGKYPDAADLDLAGWARGRLDLELRLENDAHAALLGEWHHGAGRGSDDFVLVTLGTGLGCSVLLRGRPLRGRRFQAGVLGGHLVADPLGGADCAGCPGAGCYEAESGSQSLPRLARADGRFAGSALAAEPTLDFAAVFHHAGRGDPLATAVRDHCVGHWTALFVSLVHAYDPDRIVVGGGVAAGLEAGALLPVIEAAVNRRAWTTEPVEVRAARLGRQAGVVGAGTLFTHDPRWL